MSRAAFAVAVSVIIASPLIGQERDDVRRLERARPGTVVIDSVARQYVQFLELRRAYLGLMVNTRASASDSIGALIHS
ncbi:MAG: hypothetical protein E4H37_00710, partial [Gemmatimonadales bacterium]